MMNEMQQLNEQCVTHPNHKLVFICLSSLCKQDNRIGCQKCLLNDHAICIKGCIFLNQLKQFSNDTAFAWTGSKQDIEMEKFVKNKTGGVKEIETVIDDLLDFLKKELKTTKREVMKQKIAGKSKIQKEAKHNINQYKSVFSHASLRQIVLDFTENKITDKQVENYMSYIKVTEKINQLSTLRLKLEEENQKGRILTELPNLSTEDFMEKQGELVDLLFNIENLVRFQKNWVFVKSVLSKKNHCANNINELVPGVEFQFNEFDAWQLIYGNSRMTEGKHQWEIQVDLVDYDSITQDEENLEKKTIENGFESLFVTNSNNDANNKLFSHPEYTNLNRLYIGIVSESKKDQTSVFTPGSVMCEGLDIIRGKLFGNTYLNSGTEISSVFNQKKKKGGITIQCSLDIETKKLEIKEKGGASSYESNNNQYGSIEFRPFILSANSRVKVKLII